MDKIRIGLFIDDFHQPAWVCRIIENINADSYGEIKVVVKNEPALRHKSWIQKFGDKFNLYLHYRRLEDKFSQLNPDVFAVKDISKLLAAAEKITIHTNENNGVDYASHTDVDKLLQYDIDVFLKFDPGNFRGPILKTAKFGVWSYYFSDRNLFRGGPTGYWEFYYQKKEIGSSLEIVNEDDTGPVLYRSWSAISRIHKKTMDSFYLKTSLFMERKLKELYESGEGIFFKKQKQRENEQLGAYTGKTYSVPGNFQFLKIIFRNFISSLRYKVQTKFYFDQWILLYSFHQPGGFSKEPGTFKRLLPPPDRFWADPFVVHKDHKYFIFFEELIYNKKGEKGHLSVMELTKDGSISEPQIILEKLYHLSYPFIFEHEDKWYMIPESSGDATIQLYECIDFPYHWEFKMNLMENIKAVDTTLLFKDNKFWLFTNISELPGISNSEELFLFYSDNLFSNNWKSHQANPVISDIRSSRPAGRIFQQNGKWYRPSQDCSVAYGYSIFLNEIIELTEESYKEIKSSDIKPNWAKDIIATHTLSFDNGLTVIDAQVRRRR